MKQVTLKRSRLLPVVLAALMLPGFHLQAQDEEDNSVEGLYRKAVEQNMSGDPAAASKTFEKLFDLSGGLETLFEDYGAPAGGLVFDYGMTLMPQQLWTEAKQAFTDSYNADETAKKVKSAIPGNNTRKSLAQFQLAFCEAQLGNHEEALRLYDEYIGSNPPQSELAQVRNSFKLRRGTTLLKLGRVDEGTSTIQELFDNQEAWKVTPPFLMQGLLELGLGWVDNANAADPDNTKALEAIETRAHAFLNSYGDLVKVRPSDQFRYGFVDRLKKLGFESTKAELPSLGLRYFAYTPTVQQIRDDINLRLAEFPIGSGVPSQFQQLIDRLDEAEKAEFHPDAEILRLTASCYEKLGNYQAPRSIYWHLAEHFPDVDQEKRGEILHEAARFSSMLADYPAAQYFGEKFMAEMPEDHKLRSNVATFMLQSLFTSRQYDMVIDVCEKVRAQYEPGANQRELADSLYPLALYSTKRHEEAEAPFDEYVKNYTEGNNREMVMFHRGNNSLILNKMRSAAEQLDDFLKAYPESEKFGDVAIADLATARYNLEDYPAAIKASEKLQEFAPQTKPDTKQLGRVLNIEGDAYIVQSDAMTQKEQAEQKAEWRQKGLDAYLRAKDEAKKTLAVADEGQEEYFKTVAAEAIWKAADLYYTDEKNEEGLALYDEFFPDYAGTFWEPQISVFSLEPLEGAGRGEEGLVQVEKMINVLGNKPPEEQDLTLLRQAIGSYSDASVRIKGAEPTIQTLDNFPGLDPNNQALLTWLKIQKVIVLQELRGKTEKDSPQYAAVEGRISEVFEELKLFEKRNLSEFALQQIGDYMSKGDNPFLAIPYYDELMSRTNEEAKGFKASAEMAMGRIEMRSPEAGKVQAARERFRRIINDYGTKPETAAQAKPLIPEAYLSLGKLHIKAKEWKDAIEALDAINKNKNYFGKERVKRAEAGWLFGNALEETGDKLAANKAYLSVVSTYGAFPDYVTQAWERYIKISEEDMNGMPAGTEEETLAKRARQLSLYKLCTKYIFMWQKWTDDEAPSGALGRLRRDLNDMKGRMAITPEEQQKIEFDLGLPVEEN